jgi:DNA invertase Pin-like site-specific DNA recombinase
LSIAVIAYAAKSTAQNVREDAKSVVQQIEAIKASLDREGGRELVAHYVDEAASAFKSHHQGAGFLMRGPSQEAALDHAETLVREGRTVELWVFRSDRLARGDAKNASHLSEYLVWAQRNGVTLRSVTDNEVLQSFAFAGFVGDQHHGYSKGISESVARAKRAQVAGGRRKGGPVPDGYKVVATTTESGKVLQRTYKPDPSRAPIIQEAFALSEAGHGDTAISHKLNAAGHRTRRGNLWSRRRIQDTLTNPIYAGKHRHVTPEGAVEIYEATDIDEPLVAWERFETITAARAERDRAKAGRDAANKQSARGARTLRFALSRLATCSACGETMYCRVDGYKRKRDGGQKRYYACPNVINGTGGCTAPFFDAEVVDAAIVPYLRTLFSDFSKWTEGIRSTANAEQGKVKAELSAVEDKLAGLVRVIARAKEQHRKALEAGADARSEAALDALAALLSERKELRVRRSALKLTIAELAEAAMPTDALLEHWQTILETVRGRLSDSKGMGEINAELRVSLEKVMLESGQSSELEGWDEYRITPVLRSGGAWHTINAPTRDPNGKLGRAPFLPPGDHGYARVGSSGRVEWSPNNPEASREANYHQEPFFSWEPRHWGNVRGC